MNTGKWSSHRRPKKVYSVWNNKTDELVILDGTAEECIKAIGWASRASFYSHISRAKSGEIRKWHIESRVLSREEREAKREDRCT
jgi:hypothetical protein